jgi:hypothetical protein
MSSGRDTVTTYFAIIGGLLMIGLLAFAPLPGWGRLMLGLALVTTALVLACGSLWRRRPAEATFVAEDTTPQPVHERKHITDVLLPSSRDDYSFLFTATVIWSPVRVWPDESGATLSALAVDAVLRRARQITESRDPAHVSLARYELGGHLAEMRTDITGRVRAMAESVGLVLSGHDQERLDQLAKVRKDEAVWEHERKWEQSKRDYLGRDVLKNPGSAVVWWLARNDDALEKTVGNIGRLASLASAANNEEIPETFRPYLNGHGLNGSGPAEGGTSPADRFGAFLDTTFEAGAPERTYLAQTVVRLVANCGREDIAEEIADRFDPPPTPEEAPEEDVDDDGADRSPD